MTETNKKLYRSRTERMVSGVAGGIGEYMGVDPTLIRLIFVALTLGGGAGILIYILLSILIPEEGKEGLNSKERTQEFADEVRNKAKEIRGGIARGKNSNGWRLWLGLIVIILGLSTLANQLFPGLWREELLGPILLVGVGLYLILKD